MQNAARTSGRSCGGVGVRDENKRLIRAFKVLEQQPRAAPGEAEGDAQPSWFPATYLGPAGTESRDGAVVNDGLTRRVVEVAEGVDPASLEIGDQVFLAEPESADRQIPREPQRERRDPESSNAAWPRPHRPAVTRARKWWCRLRPR